MPAHWLGGAVRAEARSACASPGSARGTGERVTWDAGTVVALTRASVARISCGDHHMVAQCDHATLAAAMRDAGVVADALVVDAPYSERTHSGHDSAAQSLIDEKSVMARRLLDYAAWSDADVQSFTSHWCPVVSGWMCSITDHVLAATWETWMSNRGRYVFSPIACVESGSRIRVIGDGPSQWSTWMLASRPRARQWQSWGTLPGAYVGGKERKAVTGGKPLWLMRAIVGDYSRPGDLVVDPCMGAGTTLVAAVELGRRAIGCEPDAGRFEIAAKRLAKARPQMRLRLDVDEARAEQIGLLGGE